MNKEGSSSMSQPEEKIMRQVDNGRYPAGLHIIFHAYYRAWKEFETFDSFARFSRGHKTRKGPLSRGYREIIVDETTSNRRTDLRRSSDLQRAETYVDRARSFRDGRKPRKRNVRKVRACTEGGIAVEVAGGGSGGNSASACAWNDTIGVPRQGFLAATGVIVWKTYGSSRSDSRPREIESLRLLRGSR